MGLGEPILAQVRVRVRVRVKVRVRVRGTHTCTALYWPKREVSVCVGMAECMC